MMRSAFLALLNFFVLQWMFIRLGRIVVAGQDPWGPSGEWRLVVGVLPLVGWPWLGR